MGDIPGNIIILFAFDQAEIEGMGQFGELDTAQGDGQVGSGADQ